MPRGCYVGCMPFVFSACAHKRHDRQLPVAGHASSETVDALKDGCYLSVVGATDMNLEAEQSL